MDSIAKPIDELTGGTGVKLLLRPRDAARALAISERTLWSLAQRGDLRAVRIGRAVAYSIEELRAFIQRRQEDAGRQ